MNKHEHIKWQIFNIIAQEVYKREVPNFYGESLEAECTKRISSLIKEHYDINDKPFESDELYRGPVWDKLCEERIGKENFKKTVEQMDHNQLMKTLRAQ